MKNEIEILKIELEQIINEEISENNSTLIVQINCELTEKLHDLGFNTVLNEDDNAVTRCFYDERNIDKLLELVKDMTKAYVYIKESSIEVTLKNKAIITIEIL